MTKEIKTETPFDYLTHKDGKAFSRETINHWYIARAYVLDKLKNIDFAPNDYGHLHVVVTDDSPLMLAVVRQVALSAHYVNYVEYDVYGKLVCTNRTIVTLVSQNENIVSELKKEEYLCNLLDYCKYSVNGMEGNKDSSFKREKIASHFHLGRCNAKTLFKRMNLMDISYEEAKEVL